MEVFQDAQAISEEIKYNQEQIQDIINQNTDQLTGEAHFPTYTLFSKFPYKLTEFYKGVRKDVMGDDRRGYTNLPNHMEIIKFVYTRVFFDDIIIKRLTHLSKML